MRLASLLWIVSLSFVVATAAGCGGKASLAATDTSVEETMTDSWTWPDSLDAVAAAPDSHVVLLENERVRVLEVVIQPGEREPVHTHRWPSVMLTDSAARIRYYGEDGELAFESAERAPGETAEVAEPAPNWLGPEGPHAVENIDTVPFHAIRVELKDG